MALKLGPDARFYIDTSNNFANASWSVCNTVKDVTLDPAPNAINVTCRSGGGSTQTVIGNFDTTVSFTILNDSADANFVSIRTAAAAKSPLHVAAFDGDMNTAGSFGWKGVTVVTKFARNEPIDGEQTYDVELKPTYHSITPAFNTAT